MSNEERRAFVAAKIGIVVLSIAVVVFFIGKAMN